MINAFHSATNYKYPVIDRFTGTSYAYGKFWNRDLNYEEYLLEDLNIWNEALLVYLEAPLEVLKTRFAMHGEKHIDLEDLPRLRKHYKEYLDKTPLYTVRIDTEKSKDACIRDIKKAITEFETEPIREKVARLIDFIRLSGQTVKTNVPKSRYEEVRNVVLRYNDFNVTCQTREQILNTIEDELPEYNEIYYTLTNTIRTKINYLKDQDIYSRQFVYHGDRCISFFHVLFRDKVLETNVHIRSSNANMLTMDCYGAYYIAS